ncbi:MAG: hypothetical protein J6X18_08780 [Bacteroidales bacterium]|nr:hypothetical protein [Bacteroidales bacterium]
MTLQQFRDKIDKIIEETPSWANCERIGIVTNVEQDTGWKDMEYCVDIQPICCDGQGMVAFQLVMEDDKYFGLA